MPNVYIEQNTQKGNTWKRGRELFEYVPKL